jgi:hypothetical protein
MNDKKLTVRVPREIILQAKRYAHENDTTLTCLITEFLRQLGEQMDFLQDARVVRRLSGILPEEATIEDYREHLQEKYGDQA